ncbi:amidohydrolase [Microbacterium sp.]|uniref:amidohydrolase n=1 Tax=Microbacterium sp. TaxID=51671 RepID=UPI003C7526C0
MLNTPPERIVTDARIYTGDPELPWAGALAITDGVISAIGSAADVESLAGPDTIIEHLDGCFIMPGINDLHTHIGIGGSMLAWEIPLLATDTKDDILAKVRERAATLGPDEWILGAAVNGAVMGEISEDAGALDELDEAAGGRPVILRDDSQHNRWVSSATLRAMGVDAETPDPEGNRFVRDAEGRLTGWLFELYASSLAEEAYNRAIVDPAARYRVSVEAALSAMNAVGITGIQDAGSMGVLFEALRAMESDDVLTARVVTSTPALPFVEPGVTGEELQAIAATHRSARIRPDFVKLFLDGVPMTRTAYMLQPYICHDRTEDPQWRGEPYWSLDELTDELVALAEAGLGAKMHAIGDGSVRQALDAVERVRARIDTDVRFQIAHVGIVSVDDRPRFAALDVVAEISPHLWYPSEFDGAIVAQVPMSALATAHPHRALLDAGVLVAAGSDWPVGSPLPSPWLGLETLVTRTNPDPRIPGSLDPAQALTLEEAIDVFTRRPAVAMGVGDITGQLTVGRSADFVVLAHDLFAVPVTDIHRTEVLATFFEGRAVHRA